MAFPFLGLFIIFLSVAAYYRKRATAQQKKVTEDFWNREDQANQIRRKLDFVAEYQISPVSYD